MIVSPECPQCGSGKKTQAHCENSQCNWIRCLECRQTSVIVKET